MDTEVRGALQPRESHRTQSPEQERSSVWLASLTTQSRMTHRDRHFCPVPRTRGRRRVVRDVEVPALLVYLLTHPPKSTALGNG